MDYFYENATNLSDSTVLFWKAGAEKKGPFLPIVFLLFKGSIKYGKKTSKVNLTAVEVRALV